jgi:hypothetical protein
MKTLTVKLKSFDQKQFKFSGIASSESRDCHDEIIKQNGIDLSLVPVGKVIVNAEHDNTTIGKVTFAKIKNNQLYIEGVVDIKTIKAKKFYELLKYNNPDHPVTLSIEFVNPEYSPKDKNQINKIVLTGVALIGIRDTPANKDTYAELLKSITKKDLLEELLRRSSKSKNFENRLKKLLNL